MVFKEIMLVVSANREICGNGIVEGDEVCDCGSDDVVECNQRDPCCTTNCTLRATALCT